MGCCQSTVIPEFPLPELPPGVVQLTVDSPSDLIEKAVECLTLSFAGTTDTSPEPAVSWVFDPQGNTGDATTPLKAPPTEERLKYFRYNMEWLRELCLSTGGCFLLTDPEEPSNVVCCAICFPPNKQKLHDPGLCRQLSVIKKIGNPPKELSNKRMMALDKMMRKAHNATTKGDHWYVQAFGTKPDCQRKGFGSRLLEFIGLLGDKSGVPVYLETTGAYSEAFYIKGGFRVVQRYIVSAGSDTLDANGGMAAMIRDPK